MKETSIHSHKKKRWMFIFSCLGNHSCLKSKRTPPPPPTSLELWASRKPRGQSSTIVTWSPSICSYFFVIPCKSTLWSATKSLMMKAFLQTHPALISLAAKLLLKVKLGVWLTQGNERREVSSRRETNVVILLFSGPGLSLKTKLTTSKTVTKKWSSGLKLYLFCPFPSKRSE